MGKFPLTTERHSYVQEWKKRTGRKVIGYFCTYVPEEFIYAAGVLPVRVLGSHEPQDLAEPYIFSMFCPFCRDCLAEGLRGKYDYLDGIAHAQSCLHIRQAFESWQMHIPSAYNHYLYMPSNLQSPSARICLEEELQEFKSTLEKWTGKVITEKALSEAVETCNLNRRLLRKLYELRKSDPPAISGAETMRIVLASMFMDKKEHSKLLEQLLEELSNTPRKITSGPRVMVLGSENDDTELVELTESLGANVVIDDHCTGSRYFWNEVILPSPSRGEGQACPERSEWGEGEPTDKLLQAIASRYIDRPPCPQKDLRERRRFAHILKLAEEYKVQAAVLIQQKFCDPHEFDIPPLQELFQQKGIPSIFLEVDLTTPVGQFRTRIEAFLETMQLELA